MGQSSSFRIAGIAIALCLIIAGIITVFSGSQEKSAVSDQRSVNQVVGWPNDTQGKQGESISSTVNRIRILWYDTAGRTYTFRDYALPAMQDPAAWTVDRLPAPEEGTVQRQAALVRFLEWDGTMERMIDTRYLIDQETVTGILNSYTLIAPPPPVQERTSVSESPTVAEPIPQNTPAPGMLIPTRGQPCNLGNETIRVSFGYISRHNTVVSLPVGDKNRFLPEVPDRGQPTEFSPGIHPDLFSVSFPANGTNIIWNLMDTTVGAGYVPPLRSGLLVEPRIGYAPLTVSISDQSSGGTVENPIIGTWNLGDGTVSEETSIIHRYEQPGTYTISRTVRTSCEIKKSDETISVYKADFVGEPVPGSPMTYRFYDRSEGNPAAWIWDFADDTTSLEQNPNHTWKLPGTYPVGLRVAGKNGSGTVVRTIPVYPV